ncbi:hypothetical protein AK88_05594, partial [Plasmodium fragile]
MVQHWADLIRQWVERRRVADQDRLSRSIWNDIQVVLNEFVDFIQNEEYEKMLTSSCDETEYGHRVRVPWKSPEKAMCRLMTRALLFMNAWPTRSARTDNTEDHNEALKEHIRCAIVNIFMYILNESPCKSHMGIHYAWEVVTELEQGWHGLITNSKCQQGQFENIQIGQFDMQTKIKEWLEDNKRLRDTFAGPEINRTCKNTLAGNGRKETGNKEPNAQIEMQHEETAVIQQLGEDLKLIVEQVKTEVVQCEQDHDACMEPIEDDPSSDPEDDDTESIPLNPVGSGKPAPTEPAEFYLSATINSVRQHYTNLGHLLAQWVIDAGISTQEDYEDMVWQKTKEVMAEFVQYMQGDDILAYASNCGNAGWQHHAHGKRAKLVTQTVGDKIVCVLMAGALFFMNGWTSSEKARQQDDATNEKIREHLRCAIVHMFSEVLNESVCKSTWGIFYAWKIMDNLGKDGGLPAGLIQQGTCRRELVGDLNIRTLKLNEQVKKWLRQNRKLKEAIQKIQGHTLCTQQWRKEWNLDDILGKGPAPDVAGSQIVEIVHALKAGLGEVFKGIKQQVEQGIEQREQAKKGQSGTPAQGSSTKSSAATPAAPATPAPAKPVDGKAATAAKPVAVKPASQPGPAKPVARTPAERDNCEWSSILDEKRKQVYVLRNYSDKDLEELKTVLQGFVEYMHKKDEYMEAMGANCNNTGWEDVDDYPRKDQTVADVIRCRLMTGALFYANGGNGSEGTANKGRGVMDEKEKQLRCEAANAFGYILDNKYCAHKTPWRRGVKYAWKTVKAMGEAGGIQEDKKGPVMKGDWTECGYKVTGAIIRPVNGNIVDWLVSKGGIMDKIGNIEGAAKCDMDWKEYIKDKEQDVKGNVQKGEIPEVQEDERKVQEVIETARKELEEETKTRKGKHKEDTDAYRKDKEDQAASGSNADNTTNNKDTSDVQTSPPTPGGLGGGGLGRAHIAPADVPPVLPPPPAQKPGSTTSAGTGSGPAAGSVPQPPHAAPPVIPGGSASGPTRSDEKPGRGAPDASATGKNPIAPAAQGSTPGNSQGPAEQCSENEMDQDKLYACLEGKVTPDIPPQVTDLEEENALNKTLWGSSRTISVTEGSTPITFTVPTGHDVVDGGNDDPPPLNPPKPKPNPNPNQSGATGSGPGGGTGPGVGGVAGEAGKGGGAGGGSSGPGSTGPQNPGSSTPGSDPSTHTNNTQGTGSQPTDPDGGFGLSLDRAPSTGSIGEGYAPPTLKDRSPSSSGGNQGPGRVTPDVPDLTDTVLTATTPVLFFLSAVIVALLGYSLWKYFAFLGHKRRRTYRTVRDVPSPPLDERTIIELHLEVLHECEAAEWENVKDDYLQILVEEFMGGNHGHSSSLDVCTPDDGLATQDSTTNTDSPTRDKPTDSDGKDPCPPNEQDPDPATHTPTCAAPEPAITDIPTSDTVTDRTTCDPVLHIPTCDTVTHTTTSDHPQPDITDSPTCKAVTDTPTCADPKPEITQAPGSGNAVTDTHTCDPPQPDITQHTVTNDTVTHIPACDGPKPDITQPPATGATVTDIPTCEDPKPEITDIPTRDTVTDRTTCDTVTDIPTCNAVRDTPTRDDTKPDITHQLVTDDTVTDTHTCEDPKPEITDIATRHDVVDGGNDDPPPLNPPKPKPNPNPNQSGATGSGPGGGTGPGVGGVAGEAGKGGGAGGGSSGPGSTGPQNPGSSTPGSDPSTHTNNTQGTGSQPTDPDGGFGLSLDRAPSTGSIGEGYAPPTLKDRSPSSSGGNQGPGRVTPDVPDLTDTVLTATTPVLFFLSAVIVALLGYSLWKYFAFLGHKRRRTYRTVRDVPSPPLDEVILDHLQRGDLPPPDYGYTMIRDRQPGRLPAQRRRRGRRPPRVHKRTIIELHLEVLHECEAAEWENVKDDYLQILVEEFMGGNHGHSSSLDVCTPDDGLATQDSTTNTDSPTRDKPTDSDGKDPCPPNEQDPDPATHTPTCAAPEPAITDIPTSDTVTDRTTCDPVLHIPTCDTVTHTTTSDHPQPDITDSPTCKAVTDTPTCADPKPEITQAPGSGNAVTDTHTCDPPQPDITQHTVTNDTVTHIPACDGPKPDITQPPATGATVTDIPTCEDPKPEITDIPTRDTVTDRTTCDTVTDRTTCDTVTDIPTCNAVRDTPTRDDTKPDITHQLVTDDTVTDTHTCEDPKPEITDIATRDAVTHIPTCEDPKPDITDIPTCDT